MSSEVWTALNEFRIGSSKELELSGLEIHSTKLELVYTWQVDCDLDKLFKSKYSEIKISQPPTGVEPMTFQNTGWTL